MSLGLCAQRELNVTGWGWQDVAEDEAGARAAEGRVLFQGHWAPAGRAQGSGGVCHLQPWVPFYFPCFFFFKLEYLGASQVALAVKNPLSNAGDVRDGGCISGLGRSPAGEHDNPLQHSCLENPMDRGAWRATAHGVTELDTTEAI